MAESATNVVTDNNLLDDNEINFKPNKLTCFTCLQIKNLLTLQLLDVNPHSCVM
jgi:hypothetical protein